MAYAYHRFSGQPQDQLRQSDPKTVDPHLDTEITKRSLAEIVELVERKLAWIGLHSMQIAHICVTDSAIQIGLFSKEEKGACRLEVDRLTGAITQYTGLLPPGHAHRK